MNKINLISQDLFDEACSFFTKDANQKDDALMGDWKEAHHLMEAQQPQFIPQTVSCAILDCESICEHSLLGK